MPEQNDFKHKLDGGLRRLLRMKEADILKMAEQRRGAIDRQLQEIERLSGILPGSASKEDQWAVRRVQELSRRTLLPHRLTGALIVDAVRPLPIKVRVIAQFNGNRDDLTALGLEVRSQAHDIFTVVGTLQQIADLAAQPATRRLRLPRQLTSTVENACTQAEVTAVHQPRPANPSGYQGNGVIVGIVDSPLDITHHGFRDPGGTHGTRVLYYWVQDPDSAVAPGQTPEQFSQADAANRPDFTGLNYGRLYTRADIDAALASATPYGNGNAQISKMPATSEHGTHVAGIAAGSGHEANWTTAPTHVGAAPQATIVHVCYRWSQANAQSSVFEDDVVNALDFILRAAAFHAMPVTINASLGTNLGPHNGSSAFDIARDNLLNSFTNRSIVWAAGNDNNDQGFRSGIVNAGATESFTFTPANMGSPVDRWLDIWSTGPELDFQVSSGGQTSGWQTAGAEFGGTINGFAVAVDRDVETGGGLRNIRLYIDNATSTATWTMQLRNPHASDQAHYFAWAGAQGHWATLSGASQNAYTIGDTAAGQSILTVGACQKRLPANPAQGEVIADYSGAGPTLDGRIKPEVVAVGGTSVNQVISARSNQSSGYVGMQGTSMAAPLVTGAVALLFEEYEALGHQLNQETVKALLTQNANRLGLHIDPAAPGYVPTDRNLYGYGRVRLIAPIDLIRPPLSVDVWIRTAADDYGAQPYPGGCFCGAPDIRVFEAGTNTETTRLTWGRDYDVRVTVRNLGDDNAVGTVVRLKYSLPWAAPNTWHAAEDASNTPLVQTTTVPALHQTEVLFHWRPEAAEIGAPAGTTHFCLLAETDHSSDPLSYPMPTTPGGDAWSANIKGSNNVALRNLFIQ